MNIRKRLEKLLKGDLMKKLKKAFIYQVIGVMVGFVAHIVYARCLGVEDYGTYTFMVNLLRLLIVPALLGFGTLSLRLMPKYMATENWAEMKGYQSFSIKIVVFNAILVLIGSYIYIYHTNSIDEAMRPASMAFMITFPLLVLIDLFKYRLQAMHRIGWALVPLSILLPILLMILVLGGYWFWGTLSIYYFAAFYSGVVIITFLTMVYGLNRSKIAEIYQKGLEAKYNIKEWFKISLPLSLTSSLQTLLKETDVLLIGILMTSTEVGLYGAAFKIDLIVLLGIRAVNFVEAPMFSKLYSQNDMKGLQKTVSDSAKILFVFTVIVAIAIVLMGKFILGFFGEEFIVAYNVLLILMVGNIINSLTGSVGVLMSMTKHQNESFWVALGSTALNLVLNYVFINLYGLEGAAIATAIAVVFRNVVMFLMVYKKLGINCSILPINKYK